ncbi:hypothetical protein QYE76_058532 [Lolium multiflorum]|uniref:eIF-4F 25 kDa subunit n=1 Tax=Lolium multiflorum TaxID=4521 RepID=A0AAD8WRQ2_LOLMU|nr:hypothetical protein QYE76_058532 [Lolium multiflorum]
MEEAEIADNDDSAGAAHGQASGQTLEHGWAFWLVSPQVEAGGKVASERNVHTFSTIDEFWSLYNNILHPSKLGVGADLYCLKNKIEPKLEDRICANGGKWAISCGKGKSDKFWVHTLLPLIGGRFEYGDGICGAVLSVRGTQDMIAVWTKDSANEPAQQIISNQWKEFMDYKDSIEFFVHDSGATTVQCWSAKFPQDLFGMIYNRVPDPRSRVRFAAVCRSWFATASQHPAPPALPWLLLLPRDGDRMKRLYCPEDNQILCVPPPKGFIHHWFIGCHEGGWVASYEPGPFRIVNLFSGFEVALSEKQQWIPRSGRLCKTMIWKIIFSKPPTSSDCVLAAITDDDYSLALCRRRTERRVGAGTTPAKRAGTLHQRQNQAASLQLLLATMAGQERRKSKPNSTREPLLLNGELYGLTPRYSWDLVKFELGVNKDGAPVVRGVHYPVVTMDHQVPPHDWHNQVGVCYIFELNGKLAMAVRFPWSGVQRNRIYYTHRRCLGRKVVPEDELVFLAMSNDDGDPVYFREDDHYGVDMIRAVGYYARRPLSSHVASPSRYLECMLSLFLSFPSTDKLCVLLVSVLTQSGFQT